MDALTMFPDPPPPAKDARPWLTPKEAAILLDVSLFTVYRMIDSGRLRWRVKPGNANDRPRFLIDPAHVAELLSVPA